MKKIAVLFHDGFEELEALSVVDVMRDRHGICIRQKECHAARGTERH